MQLKYKLHPVSYTHLDVYKRQDVEIVADVINKRNDGTSSDEEGDQLGLPAVSYTHLDVYKRQAQYSPSPFKLRGQKVQLSNFNCNRNVKAYYYPLC